MTTTTCPATTAETLAWIDTLDTEPLRDYDTVVEAAEVLADESDRHYHDAILALIDEAIAAGHADRDAMVAVIDRTDLRNGVYFDLSLPTGLLRECYEDTILALEWIAEAVR